MFYIQKLQLNTNWNVLLVEVCMLRINLEKIA